MKMKTVFAALLLSLGAGPAFAQTNETFTTYLQGLPVGGALNLSEKIPALQGGTTKTITPYQILNSLSGGDCTMASPPAIVCVKTNGVVFAPSATNDTTNATNISSGTLNVLRLPYLVASATTDTTNASNISSGTLNVLRLPYLVASATTDTTNATNISSGTLANGRYAAVNLGAGNVNGGVTGSAPIANGGTGQATQQAALNAIQCTPTRAGDVGYWNGSNWVCFAGNNAGIKFLSENASGVPSWLTSTFVAAVKADQTAASSTTVAVVPGVQQYHPSAVKAWVNFTGSSGAINDSYNIASVSRTSAGVYLILFTTSFATANYTFSYAAFQGSGTNGAFAVSTSMAAGGLNLNTFNQAGTSTDPTTAVMMFVGTQ